MTAPIGVTASVLCAPLVDGPVQQLQVAHRSRWAWQLVDARGRAVCSVMIPGAVRLPHAVVVPSLRSASSPISVGGGFLGWHGSRVRIARWWRPARPHLPALLAQLDSSAVAGFAAGWQDGLGRGDGLTPYADDVICGALVTLHAAGHPLAAQLASAVGCTPLERYTTATSAGLLRLAADGWCIDELAHYLSRFVRPGAGMASLVESDESAGARLLTVGHSSGRGLMEGVHLMLRTRGDELAAANGALTSEVAA